VLLKTLMRLVPLAMIPLLVPDASPSDEILTVDERVAVCATAEAGAEAPTTIEGDGDGVAAEGGVEMVGTQVAPPVRGDVEVGQ
jgi:hypothetical protein